MSKTECKHDWKLKGVNQAIPGITIGGKNNSGSMYVCSKCGSIQVRGDVDIAKSLTFSSEKNDRPNKDKA